MMIIQKIESFFAGLAAMGSGLPLWVLVPLIMVLAIAGTVVLVKAIQWLICFLFRDKGREFVDGVTNFAMNTENYTKEAVEGAKIYK